MTASPWPTENIENLLFLLDASHDVEQQMLESWLKEHGETRETQGQVRQVVIPISASPKRIPTEGVSAALDMPPDTLIVPLRVVWLTSLDTKDTTPRFRDLLFGNPRHPGRRKARRILEKQPGRAEYVAAAPATLEELENRLKHCLDASGDRQQLGEFVIGQASIALDIAERRLRGSRYKVPRHVAGSLRSSAEFNHAIDELSEETGRARQALLSEADKIFKELIAFPSAFWLDINYLLNRKVATLGYERNIVLDSEDLEHIRQISKQHPTAFLVTHKTHVDFPALNRVLFDNDFPAPHTFGGVNMAFAGLGFLARRAGVIFIRRSFQDDLLYKLILRQYIGFLMQKNFPLSWAFEGTRSRIGKLMPPKYGILKYVVEAAHANDARNLHVIPIAINYDLIGDVRDYAKEQSGIKKQPETLRWFIGYLRGLRRAMGKIYLDFGEPIVLEQAPSGEDKMALSKIAFQVGVEANRATPITLASLATMILLGSAPRALTRAELAREMIKLVTWVRARDIRITRHFEIENETEFSALAEVLIKNRLVTRYADGPEEIFAVLPDQEAVASYYRNTTIHYFVTKAIAELALLRAASAKSDPAGAFWVEVDRLRDLFKFEFFYTPTDEFRDEVRQELDCYEPDWAENLAADADYGRKLLRRFKPLVAHATLTQFVEAYYIVADVLNMTPDEAVTEEDSLKRCFAYGRQALLQRRISSEASIGKLLFQNGYKWLANRGLVDAEGGDIGERRASASQDLRELMHRLQRIQALALPV